MKKISFAVFFAALNVISCMKKKHESTGNIPEYNINYPAAFVVNGESNSISVIRLSDNIVTETIKLGEMSDPNHDGMKMSTGISWPHHIYKNPSETKFAIAAPSMDLSAGHSGGMNNMEGKVVILDAIKGTITKLINLQVSNHNAIFSPDGKEIWTSQMQEVGKVLVFDAQTYELKNTINVKKEPAEITFTFDGSMAFVANGGSDTVTVITVNNKQIVGQLKVGDEPVGAWTGEDGNMYIDNEEGQSITVVKVSDMSIITTINLGFMPGMASFNNLLGELWISDPVNGKVHWYNKSSSTYVYKGNFSTGSGAHAIAFNKDGNTAYITNQSAGNVSLVDVINHVTIKDIKVGTKPNGIVIKY